ncbi:hypothetical protein RCH20_002513, partial [Psychrobacter sp. PL15]|uniref:hypothetical protein n=1 Tax=Psychrobacter sp. PL15 TaxID=3071719 RepID=UPI002E03AD0D|nr:hypothetical protein [Psychrobacter sp. PL15]
PVGGAVLLLVGGRNMWFHLFIISNISAYATRPINGALFPALAIVYLNLLEGYKNGLSIILFTIFFYLVFLLAFNGSLFFTYAFFSTWVHV